MSTPTCSQCGAALHQDQAWCSLCLAGVPDAFDPLTAPLEELAALGESPVPTQPPVPAAPPFPPPAPVTVPAPGPDEPTSRGRHSAAAEPVDDPDQGGLWHPPSWMSVPAAAVPESPETVGAIGEDPTDGEQPAEVTDIDVMFSMLSAEHRAMDPTSGLTSRMDDKSARVAIMVGGALIIGAVLFLCLTVLGAIF